MLLSLLYNIFVLASPPDAAVLAQHTAACISVRHIIMASPPDVTAQVQHTAAYSSGALQIHPDAAAQAQHAAAYLSARNIMKQ